MRLAAGDLRRFIVAQIVGEQTAFRLDHKVKALLPVDLDKDRPVGIVTPQRGRHLEPGRKLGVDLYRFIFLKLFSERPFDAGRVVHHMLEDGFGGVLQNVSQIAQCRAARALLKWSQTQLADASGTGLSTVADFEIDKREPRSDNLAAIRRALEDAGVEFIPARSGKGAGVRLARDDKPRRNRL